MVYHGFWISLVTVSSECRVFDCWESGIRLESPQNFTGCIWIKRDGSDGAWPCIVAHKGRDDSAVFRLQQKPIVLTKVWSSGHTWFVSSFLPFRDTLLVHLLCLLYSYFQPGVNLRFLDSSLTCFSHHCVCSAFHSGLCVLFHEVCTHS